MSMAKCFNLLNRKILFSFLPLFFLACFSYSMWIAYYVPVYGDEPQWKLTVSRLFLDSGKLIYLFPACVGNFLLDPPITWYPARWIDAWLYADASNPFKLRQFGWLIFLVLLLVWAKFFSMNAKLSWKAGFLFIAAYFSFGMMPYLMVFNRPEQSILIWITLGIVLMYVTQQWPPSTAKMKVLISLLYGLLACLIAAAHPKGLYFLPVILVLCWISIHSLFLVGCLAALMALTSWETIVFWKKRTYCTESEWLTGLISNFTVQPRLLTTSPRAFLDSGINNLFHWRAYIKGAEFQGGVMGKSIEVGLPNLQLVELAQQTVWLPLAAAGLLIAVNLIELVIAQHQKGRRVMPVMATLLLIFISTLLMSHRYTGFGLMALGATLLGILCLSLFKIKNYALAIASCLGLSLMLLMFMQTLKNFYETSIVWPIFLLITIFVFGRSSAWSKKILFTIVLPMLFVGAAIATYGRYALTADYAKVWQTNREEKITQQLQLQFFAKEFCNIGPEANRLVLDDDTYPSFWQNRSPLLTAYVYGWWSQGTDYRRTFASQNPEGLVTKCESAPSELLQTLIRKGEFCCASKEALGRFIEANPPGNSVK
jgi:hypothetical protein